MFCRKKKAGLSRLELQGKGVTWSPKRRGGCLPFAEISVGVGLGCSFSASAVSARGAPCPFSSPESSPGHYQGQACPVAFLKKRLDYTVDTASLCVSLCSHEGDVHPTHLDARVRGAGPPGAAPSPPQRRLFWSRPQSGSAAALCPPPRSCLRASQDSQQLVSSLPFALPVSPRRDMLAKSAGPSRGDAPSLLALSLTRGGRVTFSCWTVALPLSRVEGVLEATPGRCSGSCQCPRSVRSLLHHSEVSWEGTWSFRPWKLFCTLRWSKQ